MSRSAIAYLSTKNLHHNLDIIRLKAPTSQIIAVVKANAYGHGIRAVSQRLHNVVYAFGVASIDEALIIRSVGIKTPVLLMEGVFEPSELEEASREGFEVVFHSPHQIEWLKRFNLKQPIIAWLKVNTGLARLGVNHDDVKKHYDTLMASQNIIKPVRIISHFACADIPNHSLNQVQINRFKKIVQQYDTYYSLCNSAGLFNYPEQHYQFIRPGVCLYGVSPFDSASAQNLNLKPVMTLKTSLIAINQLKKGDFVGYGAQYTCDEDMPVGVVAFGYGDGYPFTAQNGTPILINDTRCPLVGRVAMDMLMVDLRPCKVPPSIGDTVTLWGEDLPLEDVVHHTQDITWNMITSIQNRVKFVWH